MSSIIYEYIWIENFTRFKSKTRFWKTPLKLDNHNLPDKHHIPPWEVRINNEFVRLSPILVVSDPFRKQYDYAYLVYCELLYKSGAPENSNKRSYAYEVFKKYFVEKLNLIVSLEFTMLKSGVEPVINSQYENAVGTGYCHGRKVIEELIGICQYSNIPLISSHYCNTIGKYSLTMQEDVLKLLDYTCLMKYIILRLTENYNLKVDFGKNNRYTFHLSMDRFASRDIITRTVQKMKANHGAFMNVIKQKSEFNVDFGGVYIHDKRFTSVNNIYTIVNLLIPHIINNSKL